MSFIKKSVPPPKLNIGDIIPAKILDIQQETSTFDGEEKEQLRFDIELSNGYRARTWMPFYREPNEGSTMGKIAAALVAATGRDITNATEFIQKFRAYGAILLKVKGFRDYEGKTYPKLGIYADQLPAVSQERNQTQLGSS